MTEEVLADVPAPKQLETASPEPKVSEVRLNQE